MYTSHTNQTLKSDLSELESQALDSTFEKDLEVCFQREPTAEEYETLERVSGSLPLSCWLACIIGFTERFSYYGVSNLFQNYMQYSPTEHPAGMLNLRSNVATSISFAWTFWVYISPVLGAWLSDTHWGKFKSIFIFAIVYFVGLIILFVTSLPQITSQTVHLVGFIVAIIAIGLSSGCMNASMSPFVGDQIERHRPYVKVTKDDKKIIVDSALTVQKAISLYYFMLNLGSLSVVATSFLEVKVAYWAAFLLPLCFFCLLFSCLYFAKKKFAKFPPSEKIYSKCFKVISLGLRNGVKLEAAKPSLNPDKNYPWTDLFVDEVSRALYACKVFLLFPIFWVALNQMNNTFISQAGQMNLYGLPSDVLLVVNSLTVLTIIPLCDKLIYPFIRKFTPFRAITRISWGFFFTGVSMVYAAILQHFINSDPNCSSNPHNCSDFDLSNRKHVGYQLPAYIILAFGEMLFQMAGIEYAYTKAPASMKSFIVSLFLITNAFGSLIGILLGPVSIPSKMVWTFGSLGVSCFLAGASFWLLFRHYNRFEEQLGLLDFQKLSETEEVKQ